MKNSYCFFLMTLAACLLIAWKEQRSKPHVLVFSRTAGFHHASIAKGIAAIQQIGNKNNFDVDTTTNASYFTDDSLVKYTAVIFLHTTGILFKDSQRIALQRYIQAGGGFVGIHAAADAEYNWNWYNKLVGAYFLSHPQQQEAKLVIKDKSHPSTKYLPATWIRKDEWYNFKQIDTAIKVLITIDEASYKGGVNGKDHPVAWYHDYDGGRAFYTALGHTDESYEEPLFLQHLLGGIQYAMGNNIKLNYKKARSQYADAIQ